MGLSEGKMGHGRPRTRHHSDIRREIDKVVLRNMRAVQTREGLSDIALATRVGTSPAYIYQLKIGFRSPGRNFIIKFADAFGVHVTDMYRKDGAPETPVLSPKVVFVKQPVLVGDLGASAIPLYGCSGRGTMVHGLSLYSFGSTIVVQGAEENDFAVDVNLASLSPKGEVRKRDILVLSPSKPIYSGSLVLCAPYGYVDLARYIERGNDVVLIPNGNGKPYVVSRQSMQGKACVVIMVLHRPGRKMDLVLAHSGSS